MKVKKAMSSQGVRYFNSLSPKQKDKAVNTILAIKNGLGELSLGLSMEILSNSVNVVEGKIKICDKINGTKVFYFDKLKVWLPFNIKEILK